MEDQPLDYDSLEELGDAAEPGATPTRKQLLELLESADLSDEMKERLRASLGGIQPQIFGGYSGGTLLAMLFVAVIFSIILFFGYKLYKSIRDKQVKKEEKKKLKQLKKKK